MPMELHLECFDPNGIMESGQCFRMVPIAPDTVEVIAYRECLTITTLSPNHFRFSCNPEAFENLWRQYFDLDTDYCAIHCAAPANDAYLSRAIERSNGLRILRQDPWETLCGFILSQRKNIKAIRACMESLCNAYGEPVPGTTRKTFPSPGRIASLSEADLRACGLGYRAPYVLDAARKVDSGLLNLASLAVLPDAELLSALMGIHGVGLKVANCVMLFAYHRLTRAPVDVWINRVISEVYGGCSPFEGYGEYAGVYQQYLFILGRDKGFDEQH